MRCILVFDHLNDILFSKCDRGFVRHVKKMGQTQGFCQEEDLDDENDLNINYVIQLFSPIVTSQRIMSSQFGNSYTSIQCQDGTNMVFDEYMGYLFVNVGCEDINWLKRMLGICISIIQHLCGPDVSVLKTNKTRNVLVSRLLDTWTSLVGKDQAILVEALEQLTVNIELSQTSIKVLKEATERIKSLLDFQKSHALIFVENKFLALYSSRSAGELISGDLLFLSLMAESLRTLQTPLLDHPTARTDSSLSSEEYYSPESSPEIHRKSESKSGKDSEISCSVKGALHSELVLLSGGNQCTAVMPHVVHISTLTDGVSLLLLYQTCNEVLSAGLNEAFNAANAICSATSGEMEGAKRGMEQLEVAMKKVFDGVKKLKAHENLQKLEGCIKMVHMKWDLLKKQWKEHSDNGHIATVFACCNGLIHQLKELLHLTVLDDLSVAKALPAALSISHGIATTLNDFTDFLKVKALRNFTLGSRTSLSINKYLEEFPGLVHFIYIDRTNHRVTAPSLDFKSQQTIALTKKKIWSMVEFSRSHLQEGHLAVMWKDTTFSYAYFLWFEDASGTPMKPKVSPSIAVKSLPIPGVISADFYQKLIELCFPKSSGNKVRCYELFCIHLGLATSSLVLEHSRRLAATIWEVTGMPNNPLDLL